MIGGQSASSANIALIHTATPVAIAAAGALLLHQCLSLPQMAGVAQALGGVLLVIARGDLRKLLGVRLTVDDAWVVVAGLSWTAYSLPLRWLWPSHLGSAERLVAIPGGGVLVLLPFTALEWWALPQPAFSMQALGLIEAAALLPGIVAYQAYSFMLRELGPGKTGLVLYLGPVYAAFTAWLLPGEPPQAYHAIGAALILPRIWLARRGR